MAEALAGAALPPASVECLVRRERAADVGIGPKPLRTCALGKPAGALCHTFITPEGACLADIISANWGLLQAIAKQSVARPVWPNA